MILVLGVVRHLLRSTGLGHGSRRLLSGFPSTRTWTAQPYILRNMACNLLGRNGQRHIFVSSCNRRVPEKLNTNENFIKGKQDTSHEFFYKLNSHSLIH